MRIDEINIQRTKNKQSRRVGRGSGSGRGTTSGRGTKGQKSRSGSSIPAYFEGGQTPLSQRIPKKKGFKRQQRTKTFIINLQYLKNYLIDDKLTIASLVDKGYLKKGEVVKILGSNGLDKAITVETNKISDSARKQIEDKGGKVTIIDINKNSK